MNTVLQDKETKLFYNSNIARALETCQREGYHPSTMLELVDARIKAPNDRELWRNGFTTSSIRATGRARNGKPIVVYSHDSTLINPSSLRARQRINGAMVLDSEELFDLETKAQPEYIVQHKDLQNSTSGVISVSKALQHPQTIPFLGGKERAERYLKRHQEVYGKNISVLQCNDLGEVPVARLLGLGISDYCGLVGDVILTLDGPGRFLGVRRASEASKSGAAAQKPAPSLESFLQFSLPFMPTERREQYEAELRKRFK